MKLTRTIIISLFVYVTGSTHLLAQDVAVYQPEQMQADLDKFKRVLRQIHPGLYTHQTPDEFEQLMSGLMREASRPMKATSFYLLVRRMVAAIHDGHTNVLAVGNLGRAVYGQKWLPFQVVARDQRIFMLKNMSNAEISEGSEILAIDNRLSNEILQNVFRHYSVDGHGTNGLMHGLTDSPLLGFHRIFPRMVGDKQFYTVHVRDRRSQQIRIVNVEPLAQKEFEARRKEKYGAPQDAHEAFTCSVHDRQDFAVIRIRRFFKDSFVEPENTFPDFFRSCFESISRKTVRRLVIDLRGNDGGKTGNAAYLLQYFIREAIVPAKEKTTKVDSESFRLATGQTIELDERYRLVPTGQGGYRVSKFDNLRELETFQPAEQFRFDGKVAVLIDGGTVSAGGHAAGLFKQYTDAVLIGSETSGYAGTSNGVEMRPVRGEHTEVAIRIPLIHGVYNVDESMRGRGALPDHQVSNSVQDLLDNRDAVMEFALREVLKVKGSGPRRN